VPFVGLSGSPAEFWANTRNAVVCSFGGPSAVAAVGGESMRMPGAMVWIVVDEAPMRAAMYGYTSRILVLSIIIALFTAALLYLALRWLVIRPLQDLSRTMIDFRRAPEEAGTDRAPVRRNDEIGVVDREFQILQPESLN
jgi:HAMP domain-containing protein